MILHSDDLAEVHLADCLDAAAVADAMGDRRADALIFDAPFSAKTHAGHKAAIESIRAGSNTGDKALARYARRSAHGLVGGRRDIAYDAFDDGQVRAFCGLWLPLCSGWVVSITDDTLAPVWRAEFERAGLYTFAALPLVEIGGRVRLSGDGPSSWTCWIIAARPKGAPYCKWGTLPGAYVQPAETNSNRRRVVGGKPIRSMTNIVRDYSHRDDLVVDPFSGGGTTLIAAKTLGRRSIGFEQNEGRAKMCALRLSNTREQIDLFER